MRIEIIEETQEGSFTVGGIYDMEYRHNNVVFVADNKGDIVPVYSYEFVWVK